MADLTVHIDFKSPYAYLAIEHTRALIDELGITADWYPFVLDIPSYLGSAKLNKSGGVEKQARSADQWSWVKYAYYDCRRYANLRGMTIRGTEKIWDSTLAALGMLWVKPQGDEILQRYMDGIYVPFWKRELDIESVDVISGVLSQAGASVEGFGEFVAGEGAEQNRLLQSEGFSRGIFGVPTYEIQGERWFGREHLPRIRWLLEGSLGLAPDLANPLFPDDEVPQAQSRRLDVGVDVNDYRSRLAIPEVFSLREAFELDVHWYDINAHVPRADVEPEDQSRAANHRRHRLQSHLTEKTCYEALEVDDSALADLPARDEVADWAGGGRIGSPVFRIDDQLFSGRQHLPFIRAMFS